MTSRRPSPWRWPIALATVTVVGLLSALLGDGVWDALSWVALGIPLGVCLFHGLRARRRRANG
jgi:hypothetical protein